MALEGRHDGISVSTLGDTIRRRLPVGLVCIKRNNVVQAVEFNDLVSAAAGCACLPTFNSYLAALRSMGNVAVGNNRQ